MSIVYCLLSAVSHSQTWNKVGTGVDSETKALGIYKNELYFGGFYSVNPYCNIAKWDGSVWTSVVDTAAVPYCFLEYNNELYVGGSFWAIDGVQAMGIAKWNGTQWLALGSGITGAINSITDLAVFSGEVYAAGKFPSIGGVTTRGIAKWNGTNWSAVAGGLSGGFPTPDGYALVNYNNNLYVGGNFTMAGNVPAYNIARWNGTKWDSVGAWRNGEVNDLLVDTANNYLYAGGSFYKGGVARWDGFTWIKLDSGLRGNVYSLAIYHHQLYAVGYTWTTADNLWGVARWNGAYWEAVGGGTSYGSGLTSTQVYKDELYVGGGLLDAGGDTSIKWLARWYSPPDTTCKFVLQPVIESMHSLSAPSGVADTFYYTDSVAVQFYNNIASASSWQWNFGDGKNGSGKTPIHYYSSAGTYTVSVIVNYPYGPKGPCIDTAYKTITVIYGTAGVNEAKNNSLRFKVYPNPAKREITVTIAHPNPPEDNRRLPAEREFRVKIRNALGQEVFSAPFPSGREGDGLRINTSAFKQGIYFVEVCTAEGVVCHTEKIVLE